MLCFFVHSQWEKNLKSIPFKVFLSWKQCSCDVITGKVYYENLRKIPQFVNNYKRFLKNLRKTPWCTKNQAYFLIPSCLTKTISWLQVPLVCHIIFFKYPIFLCIFPKEEINVSVWFIPNLRPDPVAFHPYYIVLFKLPSISYNNDNVTKVTNYDVIFMLEIANHSYNRISFFGNLFR
jgi:hypothetical protein